MKVGYRYPPMLASHPSVLWDLENGKKDASSCLRSAAASLPPLVSASRSDVTAWPNRLHGVANQGVM